MGSSSGMMSNRNKPNFASIFSAKKIHARLTQGGPRVPDHVHTLRFRVVLKRNEAIPLVRNDSSKKLTNNGFISFRNNPEPSRANVVSVLEVFKKEISSLHTTLFQRPSNVHITLDGR